MEVGFIQGLKQTTIVEVVVEWYSKVGVCDGSDEGGMFSRGQEQAEVMTVDGDINREDEGDFYSRWR